MTRARPLLAMSDAAELGQMIADLRAELAELQRPPPSGWTAWTPTYTGITIGNGSSVGRYKVIGGDTCVAEFQFIFGSTSSLGASNTVVLPVEAVPLNEPFESGLYLPMGELTIRDANVTNYDGTLTYQSTTVALMRYRANSPVRKEILSSTAPIAAWAAGDSIRGKLIYECA